MVSVPKVDKNCTSSNSIVISVYGKDSLAIGISRLGSSDQNFAVGTLEELSRLDFGPPLHSLVLIGNRIHDMEIDYIKEFAVDEGHFDEVCKKLYIKG